MKYKQKYNVKEFLLVPRGGYDEWNYNQLKHLLEVHERFLSDVRKVLKKLLDRDSLTIIVNFLPLVYRSRSKNFSEHILSFLHI